MSKINEAQTTNCRNTYPEIWKHSPHCNGLTLALRFQAKMIIFDYGKLDHIICGLQKMA